MYAWELKLASVIAIALVMFGSYGYVSANVKNPNAPLQPEVAKTPEPTRSAAPPTPIPSLVGTRRGTTPRATASPAPRLNLLPGVQATSLPAVTFTHTS